MISRAYSLQRFVGGWLVFVVHIQLLVESKRLDRPFNNSVTALLVFGDSTVDSGNNNFIATAFRSNFPPYGSNFPGQVATGRFCDGRLVTDFIASYIGIKDNLPPYLDPKLSIKDLKTGVSFASAGSGLDPLTTTLLGVIPMQKQLEYFKEYKKKIESAVGRERMKRLLSKAVYVISAGINDIAITYFLTAMRQDDYNINTYHQFLLQILQQFIQTLKKEGAKMIAVVGQPPIGCIPVVITVANTDDGPRRCNETLSSVGFDYNQKLQKVVKKMDDSKLSRVIYADIFNPVRDMIKNPSKFGFKNVDVGCCGSGIVEMSFLCNPKSRVCSNPKKYIFFDSTHATEATYKYLFQALRPTIDKAITTIPH